VINDLKDQVAELSINIAQKVLKDELNNKDKHEKLVERLLKESNIK
jgi:F-type H+-transporting ATPase subunit b